MAAAFAAGALPPPAPMPAGSADEQADALAKMVAARDEGSTAALVTAMLASGFVISRADGTTLKTGGGQGMAIDEWQIAAMAKQFGQGRTIPFDRLTRMLRWLPGAAKVPIDSLLLADIRQDAADQEPTRRFWARFIAGLGKHATPVATAYDLLDQSTVSADVALDAVQSQLLLVRLAGDFAVLEKQAAEDRAARMQPMLQFASYRVQSSSTPAQPPCVVPTNAGVILDYNALGVTFGFGKAMEAIKAQYPKVEGYVGKAAIANVLLNVAKFLTTYAALDVKINMDSHVLTRTKTIAPGETRTLTADVKIDTGTWLQMANCIRPALNVAGLDFSVPTNGAVSNVLVTWQLLEDEDADSLAASAQAILHNANITEPGADNTQDSSEVGGVYLKAKKQQEQFTDANGRSTITVLGAPQANDLSRKLVKNVERQVRVAAFVQVKTTNLPDVEKDPWPTASAVGDYLGPMIALLTGDKLGAIVGLSAETLYRSAWYSSDSFPFTVKDWQACDDRWSGRVQAITTGRFEDSREIFDRGPAKTTRRTRMTVSASLSGGGANTESVDFSDVSVTETTGKQFCATNARPPYADFFERDTTDRQGSGSGAVEASVTIDADRKVATIEITPKFEYKLTMTEKKQVYQACPGVDKQAQTRTFDSTGSGGIRITDVPLGTTTGVLAGSKTMTLLDGSQVVYTWHLTRCK
jgi:hypothetical protein